MAKRPRIRLRRFLYLNEEMTNEFLAQLEGGLFAEEQQTETTKQEKGGGLGARLGPVNADARLSSGGEETAARTVQQVAEASFSRLMAHLETGEALQFLETFDEDVWNHSREEKPSRWRRSCRFLPCFSSQAWLRASSPFWAFLVLRVRSRTLPGQRKVWRLRRQSPTCSKKYRHRGARRSAALQVRRAAGAPVPPNRYFEP